MGSRIWIVAAALAGCAAAPVTRTGDNEWVIGDSGRDAWHRDASVREAHARRAAQLCGGDGGTWVPFDPVPPDNRFHFRCVPPERSTAQQLEDARQAWYRCMEREEPAVDDMLSDGHTVAAVLATRCEVEVQTLLALAAKGHRNWFIPDEALQRKRRQFALDMVLQTRARKRNPDAVIPPTAVPSIGPGD